jgi:diaminohydroxyphosphoribosylaminopyrimidine deaminase / 5-amino-6-(5-phosphoribosylamino)uracil reductase
MPKPSAELDKEYMHECILLAKKGAGYVSPNPMVGAVIVRDGKIIGRGFHAKFGEPHAEVNAIRNTKGEVKGATLYVNLEPCNFTGKTPPCTDLIIQSGIARVVVGMEDLNPRVSGNGIRQLRRSKIKVDLRILHQDCLDLNKAFIKFITRQIPYVTLKAAQTLDAKIADRKGNARWISNEASRIFTHQLRVEYDAILVGANTVRKDNPSLTVRHVKGRNPKRVVICPSFNIALDANVFSNAVPESVFLFADAKSIGKNEKKIKILSARGVKMFFLQRSTDGSFSTKDILKILGEHSIASVLVEGGAITLGKFLEENTADEMFLFIAPKILGSGTDSIVLQKPRLIGEALNLKNVSAKMLDDDVLINGYF